MLLYRSAEKNTYHVNIGGASAGSVAGHSIDYILRYMCMRRQFIGKIDSRSSDVV